MKTLSDLLHIGSVKPIDMRGFTWGHWRVIGIGRGKRGKRNSRTSWLVQCDCSEMLDVAGTDIRNEARRARIKCWRCDP